MVILKTPLVYYIYFIFTILTVPLRFGILKYMSQSGDLTAHVHYYFTK